MARDHHQRSSTEPPPPPPPAAAQRDIPVGDYLVKFAGLRPHQVTAASVEEAVAKAKAELGVIHHESPPEVYTPEPPPPPDPPI